MKKILALILALTVLVCLAACSNDKTDTGNNNKDDNVEVEFVYNGFEYQVNEKGTYEIIGYRGTDKDITVPASIEGRKVTGIGTDAFKALNTLTSVTIPDSITYIADFAFAECDYITKIVLPDSITTLGVGAFYSCSALAEVTLSASLTEIGDLAFFDCDALASITLPEGLTTIGVGAFFDADTLNDVVIPSTVTSVGKTAFFYCNALTSVTVKSTNATFGEWALGGKDEVTVKAYENSTAQAFAEANGMAFEAIVTE